MADGGGGEEGKSSGKSKFLSKSKWGKVFREREDHEVTNPSHTNSFKLNDDVNDFLKPSTDRAAAIRPKLDVAIAQRWPNAQEIKETSLPGSVGAGGVSEGFRGGAGTAADWTAAGNEEKDEDFNLYRKPVRRRGLAVGFVKTAPEVIGEGGDEALDPVSEIGRLKARVSRSVSDRRPNDVLADTYPWANPQAPRVPSPQRWPPGSGSGGEGGRGYADEGDSEDFRAPPLRRAQTSHNEFSPPVQRQLAQPTLESRPSIPVLSRTPTGFSVDESTAQASTFVADNESYPLPTVDPRFAVDQPQQFQQPTDPASALRIPKSRAPAGASLAAAAGLSPAPRDPASMGERRRSMRANEGMTFRRASALIMPSPADDTGSPGSEIGRRDFYSTGVQPSAQHYDHLSRLESTELAGDAGAASDEDGDDDDDDASDGFPESATAESPSPFADPKYLRSHTRDAPGQQQYRRPQVPQVQLPVQPNYLGLQAQPTLPDIRPTSPLDLASLPARKDSRPGVAQNVPQSQPVQQQRVPPPPIIQPPRVDPRFSESLQANQRPSPDSAPPSREGPISSKRMSVVEDSSRSASRSPLQERPYQAEVARPDQRPYYARPNGSNTSLGRPPPSPRFEHSPSSSHQSDASPRPPNSPTVPFPPADRTTSAQNRASRDVSPNAAPAGRPSSRARGPSEPAPASANYPVRSPHRLSASNLIQDQIIRPEPVRPSQNFSVPRSPNAQNKGSPNLNTPQNEWGRTPSGGSASSRPRPSNDYFMPGSQPARNPTASLRQEENRRPSAADSARHGGISPLPPAEGNPAADAASADFAARVAHMKGVFRLTAEKEQPADRCSPNAWLRAAAWWYLRGKTSLDALLQQRRNDGQPRELLMQAHVDLAKTWWILSDPLEQFDGPADPMSAVANVPGLDFDGILRQCVGMLLGYLKSICLVMGRNQLLPPHQSLIQGQDTTIWHQYPHFTADAVAVLGGATRSSLIIDPTKMVPQGPLDNLPLSDTRTTFYYNRFSVEVSMSTDEATTDRVSFPCMLSLLRGRRDYQSTVIIASQTELVNVRIGPRQSNSTVSSVSWQDVTWKASSSVLIVRLPRGFDIAVRLNERDFRSLWNMCEYSRSVERSLSASPEERLVFETRLPELQYADSSGTSSFPSEKVRGCSIMAFERHVEVAEAGQRRRIHRGFRLLVVTEPGHKSLSFASHDVCRDTPFLFEFMTDSAAANGMVAMIIRFKEEKRQCRVLLVFPDIDVRQTLYDVLNGLDVKANEEVIAQMDLAAMNFGVVNSTAESSSNALPHPALARLSWQCLSIAGTKSNANDPRDAITSLRIAAQHSTGCMTDCLNLNRGDIFLRLPTTRANPTESTAVPANTIQLLRPPQEDLSASIETRHTHPITTESLTDLLRTVQANPTIRSLSFPSQSDLHAFQTALTGFSIRFDGTAASFAISRRRAVVPLHKKYIASNVRVQVVSKGASLVNVVAFMEDFAHADAMCFQVKSTDVFEFVKEKKGLAGAGAGGAVRLVDAKFSLPPEREKSERAGEDGGGGTAAAWEKAKRRFVRFEGLEYAEEHDDIIVGFEREEDRDRFASALPAETTAARGLTLMRRI